MKWENLKNFTCPHCSEKLHHVIEKAVIVCTACTFNIEEGRFEAIRAHRSNPERATIRLRWQNIREDRCPMCGERIRPTFIGQLALMRCSSAQCTFKIREDRLEQILTDEHHPANTFYKKQYQNHGDTNQK